MDWLDVYDAIEQAGGALTLGAVLDHPDPDLIDELDTYADTGEFVEFAPSATTGEGVYRATDAGRRRAAADRQAYERGVAALAGAVRSALDRRRVALARQRSAELVVRVELSPVSPDRICRACREPRCDALAFARWPDGLEQNRAPTHVVCGHRTAAFLLGAPAGHVVRDAGGAYRRALTLELDL